MAEWREGGERRRGSFRRFWKDCAWKWHLSFPPSLHWLEVSHMPTYRCLGGKRIQSGCVPRKKRGWFWLIQSFLWHIHIPHPPLHPLITSYPSFRSQGRLLLPPWLGPITIMLHVSLFCGTNHGCKFTPLCYCFFNACFPLGTIFWG